MSDWTPYDEEEAELQVLYHGIEPFEPQDRQRLSELYGLQEGYRRRIADEAAGTLPSMPPDKAWLVETMSSHMEPWPGYFPGLATVILDAWRTEENARVKALKEAAEGARHRFSMQNGEVSEQVWNDNYEAIKALDAALESFLSP